MKLTILLLIVGVCIVTAKYLPNYGDNPGQLLNRYKRSDSDQSDGSSEDGNDSNGNNDGDDDLQNSDEIEEQSKQIAKIEKMRQKLLEKQEKELKKQEEVRRKLEEKIAKELEKEEEKRLKEKRKQEEKLEKERKKLEEEQKKIQEKILENERKRQERIDKELEEIERNTRKIQESSDSYADDSIKELLKIQIYSKYGIDESNTNLEKKEALRRYLQEELGLNANTTESERRRAILDLVQNKLQNASEINALQNQLMEYVKYVGVQKIRGKIEKDIEKLQNKTETLNNVNSTWVSAAKQNIAEQVSFLETIKQILPNVLPSWVIGSQPQANAPDSSIIDNKNLRNSFEVSPDSNNLTQEISGLDIVIKKPTDNSNSVSVSDSDLGEAIEGALNTPVSIAEVTSKSADNVKEVLNNGVSAILSSSVVTEASYTNSELGQNLSPINAISSVNEESNISPLPEIQNITNEVVSSTFNSSPNQEAGVSSSDSSVSNIVAVDITTEYAQNPLTDTASSLNSADESSLLLPNPKSTKVSVLSGNNDQSFDSINSTQISEVNPSLVSENNNKLADTQNVDASGNINTLSTISSVVTIGNAPVPNIDTIPALNLESEATSSQPGLGNETSSLLSVIKDDSYAGQNIDSSSNNSPTSNLLPGDSTTEFVSNLILDSVLSVNSAGTPFISSSNNNVSSGDQNEINEAGTSGISNIISEVATSENVPNLIIDIKLPENSSFDNSTTDLVSGNNKLPNNEEITDSLKNASIVEEVTAENVQKPFEDITLSKLGDNINLPAPYLNFTLSENVPNVVLEINTESSNNILKQGIDSVGEIIDFTKTIIQQNVSSPSDNNNSNGDSTGLQSILSQIPNLDVKVGVTNLPTSSNEAAIDVGNILNAEQQVTLNEVTPLSTEQSVTAETTLQEASTTLQEASTTLQEASTTLQEASTTLQEASTIENILENTEIVPTITVPEEPGAVIVDILKQ